MMMMMMMMMMIIPTQDDADYYVDTTCIHTLQLLEALDLCGETHSGWLQRRRLDYRGGR
jgi:hypothetical protein